MGFSTWLLPAGSSTSNVKGPFSKRWTALRRSMKASIWSAALGSRARRSGCSCDRPATQRSRMPSTVVISVSWGSIIGDRRFNNDNDNNNNNDNNKTRIGRCNTYGLAFFAPVFPNRVRARERWRSPTRQPAALEKRKKKRKQEEKENERKPSDKPCVSKPRATQLRTH